jgi:hypothetical protein
LIENGCFRFCISAGYCDLGIIVVLDFLYPCFDGGRLLMNFSGCVCVVLASGLFCGVYRAE